MGHGWAPQPYNPDHMIWHHLPILSTCPHRVHEEHVETARLLDPHTSLPTPLSLYNPRLSVPHTQPHCLIIYSHQVHDERAETETTTVSQQ